LSFVTAAVLTIDFQNRQSALRQDDWTGYGRELEKLEKILKEISGMKKEKE